MIDFILLVLSYIDAHTLFISALLFYLIRFVDYNLIARNDCEEYKYYKTSMPGYLWMLLNASVFNVSIINLYLSNKLSFDPILTFVANAMLFFLIYFLLSYTYATFFGFLQLRYRIKFKYQGDKNGRKSTI